MRSAIALDRLRDVAAEPAAPPGLKQAALEAVKRVERWGLLTSTIETIFQGVSLSSILLLMALGLAIVFGLMGVINMAHGELMALGAYATFVVQGWFAAHAPGAFDYYFLVALPVSFLVAGAAGFLLERGVIRFLYGRPLETLLLTWGVSLMIQQGLRLWFGAANVDVTSPKWLSGGIPVMVGAAASVQPDLHHRARHGLGERDVLPALPDGRGPAHPRGDPEPRDGRLPRRPRRGGSTPSPSRSAPAWPGSPGARSPQIGNVGPELGQNYIVDSFMVVVTGGVGKLLGSILAALGIGGLNKIIEPSLGAVYGKVLILVFVILFIQRRPSGLFAAKGRYADA